MKKHLISCLQQNAENKMNTKSVDQEKHYLIRCQAKYFSYYWIYLSVSESTTLSIFDKFLRKLWLECCGHLSSFSFVEVGSTISKKTKVGELFDPRLKLIHTYDFGASTILEVKVEGLIELIANKSNIQLMSRNEFPTFTCNECDKMASYLCIYCAWGDEGNLCDMCHTNHNCEPSEDKTEYIVTMNVNSPRFGVCGTLEIE